LLLGSITEDNLKELGYHTYWEEYEKPAFPYLQQKQAKNCYWAVDAD
jgi:hypothetical protein